MAFLALNIIIRLEGMPKSSQKGWLFLKIKHSLYSVSQKKLLLKFLYVVCRCSSAAACFWFRLKQAAEEGEAQTIKRSSKSNFFLGPIDTDFSIPYLSSSSSGEEASDQRVVLQALRPAEPLFPSCTLTNICKLEYLTN